MNIRQWDTLLNVVEGRENDLIPTGFIIDCPWLPGWYGVNMHDYFGDDQCWFEANKKAVEKFPDVIFLPGFWAEYGMCTEPSAFGAKCQWFESSMPHAEKILTDISQVDSLLKPNVKTDGLLPFVISRLKRTAPQIEQLGHEIKFAIARGPLNIASFLLGTTEFMMAMMTDSERCEKLMDLITDFLIDWIGYQIESFPSIDGIFLLDDIIGFIGDQQCRQYVVPYFKQIYNTFNTRINFLHNDANCLVVAPYLAEMGVNLLNPGFEYTISELKKLTGDKVAILGNIPPRDILAQGSPRDVKKAVNRLLNDNPGKRRVILSCGGGMPQNVSTENIEAFVEASKIAGTNL